LDELQLDPREVVVEHNGEIIRHRLAGPDGPLSHRLLSAGDTLEIVHFVGGG